PGLRAKLESGHGAQRTWLHRDWSFHASIFRCGDAEIGASIRIVRKGVPALDKIAVGAEELFESFARQVRGLILISGETGSGKWTAACALADRINQSRADRIFIVESRTGYVFENVKSMVSQLRVGQDVDSYPRALEIALDSDLDVLAVDDIPTLETLRMALILAESGHLVIANTHADSAIDALQRLEESAGSQASALRRS